ncbi:MAG: STAS domain-containing protein [Rhodanobacter sp.]
MTRALAATFQLSTTTPDTLSVSGVLSFETAAAVWHSLQLALASGAIKYLDLADVQRGDSAGLACVVASVAAASEHGRTLQVLHVPAGMQALAQVCEVDRLIV